MTEPLISDRAVEFDGKDFGVKRAADKPKGKV